MSNTINIGGIQVSKFYLGGSSDVKIYLGTTKLYPHLQEPCFVVVDNISTYTARTYVDVYETSSDKWYKLNNLNAYEEYGIYGSGRTITYYEGKLTIDGDYEYQYSGSSWVNVGEISGDTPYDYSQDYLTLQALESGTIGFSAGTVDYSTDSGSTWNTLAQGNTISVSQGDEVLFKKSVTVPDTYTGIGTFTSSCRFNVYGNIMSMQEGDNFATATTIANYEFYFKRLFAESKVVSAENMVLPATTLQNFCYNELFKDATYLTTPPKVYPATALTQDCYSHSYNGCTSLTKSPVICGETAARGSFAYMFTNCTSLTAITCLVTDISAIYATTDWVNGVQTNSGTFYKNPNAFWSSGSDGVPYGWTVEDYVEPSPFVYPVYYDEIQDPPNYLSFSSMTEAEEYECPWVGMKATIAGSGYTFSGDSQSGYEWVYNPSRLPVGYTEVQYIENTDYASLEINYHPNQDTRVVTTMQAVSTNENPYGRFLGSGHWNCEDGTHGWQFDYEESPTGQLHISWGAECGWSTYNVYGDYSAHTYDWNKNEFYIDSTLVASTTYQNFTCETNLGIFAQILGTGEPPSINGDGYKEYLRGKLYDFKIYDDGALVADLVPCTNPNNVAGVYDIINDVFYTAVNQGYYFVAGPAVN